MQKAKAVLLGAAGATVFVLLDKLVSVVFVGAIKGYGWWAYPIHTAVSLLLGGAVLMSKRGVRYALKAEKTLSESRFKWVSRFWAWVRSKGQFWLVFAGCFVLSSLLGAGFARLLKLSNRKAWQYMIASTVISSIVWVSFYKGLIDQLIAWIM